MRTPFDAEQLLSVSTFCPEGELSADSSSLARARMASSRLFRLHHVQAAATVRTSKRTPARSDVSVLTNVQQQKLSLVSHLLGDYLRSDLSLAQLTTKTSQSQRSGW